MALIVTTGKFGDSLGGQMTRRTRIPQFGCAMLSIPFLGGGWYILATKSLDFESESSDLNANSLWMGLTFFLLFVAAALLLGFFVKALWAVAVGREVPEEWSAFKSKKRARKNAADTARRDMRDMRDMRDRLAKATCQPGDNRDAPDVVHCWLVVDHGQDRRTADEFWPRGRIRWYSSMKCEKCGAAGVTHTEWESDY